MMISGTVTGDREIVIELELVSAQPSTVAIRAVVDTGFNGYLTLPKDVLNLLEASAAGIAAQLGDGKFVELDVYVVTVNWRDDDRDVLALHAEATPLVGMSLLWGCRLGVEAQEGGVVTIEAISKSDS